MSRTLSGLGFRVEKCELEYRPTKLNPDTADSTGGVEGWLRLMGAPFLEAVDKTKREMVLEEVCGVIDSIVTREEDGSKWMGYVRLRVVATKS